MQFEDWILQRIGHGDDALSGIFAVVLSAPWSALLDKLLPGTGSGNLVLGLGVTVIGAAFNASLIYFLSRWIVGKITG